MWVTNLKELVLSIGISDLQYAIDVLGTERPRLTQLAIGVHRESTRRGYKPLTDPIP
jgi:hypothetical protein